MIKRAAWIAILAFATHLAATHAAAAEWTQVKTGPFVVYSQAAARQTRERAAELEQFRYSLGELLGRRDLTLHPPLQVFLFKTAPAHAGPFVTRTGATALLQSDGSFPPQLRETLARLLLTENVGRMPPAFEHGLELFLSTTKVEGAKVIWGAPPPSRDNDWASVAWLVTNPETFGKFRVLLANLENNVDEGVAYRNALGKSPADVAGEVRAFLAAGRFPTIDAPSRALSVDRDLAVHPMDADDMKLHLADLLTGDSEAFYRDLLNANRHRAEAEEGLALLAARRNDVQGAATLLRQAIEDGSKNAAALVEYARIETDHEKARDALEDAIRIDPNSAEAHFLLGKRSPDSAQQVEQWSIATRLAPRKQEYWIALAQAYTDERKWPDAARAWRGAEQAAPNAEEREKMMHARLSIEGQRLDFQDSEKRKAELAREQDISRLKQQARAELRAAEAKANANNGTRDSSAGVATVNWDDVNPSGSSTLEGTLIRVECIGKQQKVTVRTNDGKILKLSLNPASTMLINPAADSLACGSQKERTVSLSYNPKANARTGVAGDAVSIQFR